MKCLKYKQIEVGIFGIRKIVYLAPTFIMKQLFALISLALLLNVSTSCNKPPLPVLQEETGTNTGGGGTGTTVSPFVGTWNYTKVEMQNGTLSFMGNAVGTFVGAGSDIVGQVILTEKPNRYTTQLAFTANIDVTVFGQQQKQSLPVDQTSNSGTWTEANGKITLTDDKGSAIDVISSNSNQIIFTGNFTQSIAAGQGLTLNANSDVVFTITK